MMEARVSADAQGRQDIEAVLNPRRAITYTHVDRAVTLAISYKWNVAPADKIDNMKAVHSTRTIYSTPIYGDKELASFAHEGGHVEDPDWGLRPHDDWDGYRNSFDGELFAWRFAMQLLGHHRWNRVMNSHMNDCLWSYRPDYVRNAENRLAMEMLVAEGQAVADGRIYLPDEKAWRERQQRLALVEAAVTRCRDGKNAR